MRHLATLYLTLLLFKYPVIPPKPMWNLVTLYLTSIPPWSDTYRMRPRNLDYVRTYVLTYVQKKKTIFELNFINKKLFEKHFEIIYQCIRPRRQRQPRPLAWTSCKRYVCTSWRDCSTRPPRRLSGGPDWDFVGHKTLLEHTPKLKNWVDWDPASLAAKRLFGQILTFSESHVRTTLEVW